MTKWNAGWFASMIGNIFSALPPFSADTARGASEIFEDILRSNTLRIERIISQGQSSPAVGWYDQDENEWVMVLEGAACILLEDGSERRLEKGDYLTLPAHTKHKVSWTDPDRLTVWLAVFY